MRGIENMVLWIFNFEKGFACEHRDGKCSKGCTSERADPIKTPSCPVPYPPANAALTMVFDYKRKFDSVDALRLDANIERKFVCGRLYHSGLFQPI